MDTPIRNSRARRGNRAPLATLAVSLILAAFGCTDRNQSTPDRLDDCAGPHGKACDVCPALEDIPEGWTCVPAGEFVMGTPPDEPVRRLADIPAHPVRLTRAMLVQTTEVTEAAWQTAFDLPRDLPLEWPFGCPTCPIVFVNWFEAAAYANALSERDGLQPCHQLGGCVGAVGEGMTCAHIDAVPRCLGYRLPTEAEWEYVARAGTRTRFWTGDDETDVLRAEWLRTVSGPVEPTTLRVHPVASKAANPWGLYDVIGNAAEWCSDGFEETVRVGTEPAVDPVGPASSFMRATRGGSVAHHPRSAHVTARLDFLPRHRLSDVGFRLVRTVDPMAGD